MKAKTISSARKLKAVKEHLLDNKPISKISEELGISPKSFYRWQQELFNNGEVVFSKSSQKEATKQKHKLNKLESELDHKNRIISEIIADNFELKKKLLGDL